jgi:diacylglycerol kinase (ATP)
VIADVARSTWPGGRLAYAASALRQLFGYRGLPIAVAGARGGGGPEPHLMLVVANGRHFGGAFRIAPGASLTDGRLDAVAVGDASALGRLRLLAAAARGAHVGHPEVAVRQAAAFSLVFAAPPAYEADGEYRRAESAAVEVRCVPLALRVVTPAAPPAPAGGPTIPRAGAAP